MVIHQAHHIVEERVLRILNQDTVRAPAVILLRPEHVDIHRRINALMPNDDLDDKSKEIRAVYEKV